MLTRIPARITFISLIILTIFLMIIKRSFIISFIQLVQLRLQVIERHNPPLQEPIIRLKREIQEARREARQKARALLMDRGVEFIDRDVPKVIWTFFGGPLSENRAKGLEMIDDYALKRGLKHIHVTFDNIHDFEAAEWHPVFEDSLGANEKGLPKLLSGDHISDYFRAYIGYYFGGWYSDVKPLREEVDVLDYLENMAAADKSLTGFVEELGGVGYSRWAAEMVGAPIEEVHASRDRLISNGAFGTRPGSVIFSDLVDINDEHLTRVEETLRQHPAVEWRCCQDAEYPIEWANLFGNILHSLEYLHPKEMHIISNMTIKQAYELDNYK